MEILASPITEIGKCLFVPLKRQICYIINYKKNLANLKKEARYLSDKQTDMQNSVERAQMQMDEPTAEVLQWLKQVKEVQEDVERLAKDVSQNNKCLKGLCPDWISRGRLSKQAVENLGVVKELQGKGNSISTVSHPPPPPSVEMVPNNCVEGLHSRVSVMDQIMKALEDKNIRSIGLHGMGGVGKTTLINQLNNDLAERQLFKKVIFVTVSNTPDLGKIQDQIARRLGLKFDPESSKRNKLLERLKKEETVLIIFDDVWEKLDVAEIGIPTGTGHMGCKIIVTTRTLEVCSKMEIQTKVKMEVLTEEESLILFERKAGDLSNCEPIAKKIVQKCQGCPLAIITLALLLREKEEYEWRNALSALEKPRPTEINDIMPEVITSLKFSYDHLNEREKLCFLFCCMFPEDYEIELSNLTDYGIGEGFLEVDGTLKEASNKLLVYVGKLKDSGLLLDGNKKGHIKMHDVVRHVAISIASKDKNPFLIKAGAGKLMASEMKNLDGYKRISFMNNKDFELPSALECPQLSTLLLRGIGDLKMNPNNVFEKMKALEVLDLSYTQFTPPSPPVYLTKLRTLCLERCDLGTNVSMFRGLKNLEILRLSGSIITELPEQIGKLTNLKCLDLNSSRLSIVKPNVLSRLSKLEELYMSDSFCDWDAVGPKGESNASFAEVVSLAHLTTLHVNTRDAKCTSQEISCSWENLNYFHVNIGHVQCDRVDSQNCVCLYGANSITHWVKVLFKRTQVLTLQYCHGYISFTKMVAAGGDGLENLEELKELHIRGCDGMVKILEESKTFKKIRLLRIANCKRLKSLFSFSIAQELQDLEELSVSCCGEMREIIENEQEVVDQGFLPKLKCLELNELHCLTSIFPSRLILNSPMEHILVVGCPNLKRLFYLGSLGASYLQKLEVNRCKRLQATFSTEGLVELEGNHVTPMFSRLEIHLKFLRNLTSKEVAPLGSLQNLKTLQVFACNGAVEYLLLSSLAEGLQQLEKLEISFCHRLSKILSNKDEEGEQVRKVELTSQDGEQVRKVEETSRQLTNFSNLESPKIFQNLRFLRIKYCCKLKNLFSFNLAQGLCQLKELHVSHCKEIEEIIANEEHGKEEGVAQGLLPQLTYIKLKDIFGLTSICHGKLLLCSPLEHIKVSQCPNLKRLSLKEQGASKLVEFSGEDEWFEGLEWEYDTLKSCIQSLIEKEKAKGKKEDDKEGEGNQAEEDNKVSMEETL